MQYTDHYNLNLPEGTDIVNPLVQDNPNYTAIDSALYANKLRVIGTATELTTGTVHALTRADQDIAAFKFVATSDYHSGDTFTVDGVSVTAKLSNGISLPEGSYKINSTVVCELNGSLLNILNIFVYTDAAHCMLSDGFTDVETALANVENLLTWKYVGKVTNHSPITIPAGAKEIYCVGDFGNACVMFPAVAGSARSGYYVAANENGDIYASYASDQVVIGSYLINGLDVISQGVSIYYR